MIRKAVFLMQTKLYDSLVRESNDCENFWEYFKQKVPISEDIEHAFVEIYDPFPNLTPGQEECSPGEFLSLKFYYNVQVGSISWAESGNVSQIFGRLRYQPEENFKVIVNPIPIDGKFGEMVGIFLDY